MAVAPLLPSTQDFTTSLDELLFDICEDIQLSATRHDQVVQRILVPKARWRGAGVYSTDAFSEDQFFVMDVGLSQSPLDPRVAWAG
jgi:hypothetical protein